LMVRWTLKCENCGFPFTHSLIDDSSAPNFFLPEKPDFPVGGSELECPNCGHEGDRPPVRIDSYAVSGFRVTVTRKLHHFDST